MYAPQPIFLFLPEKLALLYLLKEVKTSPELAKW